MFQRTITPMILADMTKNKVLIIYGPRQVGKTTLSKYLLSQKEHTVYVTCDDPFTIQALTNQSASVLRSFFGKATTIVIDEAQRVPNIGLSLKLLHDTYPDIQIIATGSSSFDLSQKITEPLTGRKYEYMLYPLSLTELASSYSVPELRQQLFLRLIYGMYPEIVLSNDPKDVMALASSYLFKDILEHQQIRNPALLTSLLQALAFQIGSEVSYTELGQLLGVDKATIIRYCDLLEKCFIIITIKSLQRNMRNELKKSKKIYFVDIGLRNAIINNLNPPNLRDDMGKIWENFAVMELIKHHANRGDFSNRYFWRTHDQKEIDLIREEGGILHCYEMKRGKKKTKIPQAFVNAYPNHTYTVVSPETIWEVVGM